MTAISVTTTELALGRRRSQAPAPVVARGLDRMLIRAGERLVLWGQRRAVRAARYDHDAELLAERLIAQARLDALLRGANLR